MTGIQLREPRRRKHTRLGCRYPPGLKLAEDTSGYSDTTLGFGRQEWEWSLRGDGRVWIRLVACWYWEGRDLVQARRREPKTWYETGELSDEERERVESGDLTPALALAGAIRARGHSPASLNGHTPWQPSPPPKPMLLSAPVGNHRRAP